MVAAVLVAGLVVEGFAWWLVASRRLDVWVVMTPALAALGLLAIAAGPPGWSPDVEAPAAVAVGVAVAAALYLATRLFVSIVRPWDAFQRHSRAMYLRQGRRSLGGAVLLSVLVLVPGEELFWRGLVQPELRGALEGGAGVAAICGWAAFAAANLPSANLAIVAGAVVGGAVWSALGWWTGGALSPLVSHAVWTALMLSLPVVRRAEVAS